MAIVHLFQFSLVPLSSPSERQSGGGGRLAFLPEENHAGCVQSITIIIIILAAAAAAAASDGEDKWSRVNKKDISSHDSQPHSHL